MSSILVTFTSRSDSYFQRLNISFYASKLDGVELNSEGLDDRVRKKGQKILWLSGDCIGSRRNNPKVNDPSFDKNCEISPIDKNFC